MTKNSNSKQRGAIEYTNFLVSVIGILNFFLYLKFGAWVLVFGHKIYQNIYLRY